MALTVAITGARGNLGTKLRHHFEALGWSLRLLDLDDGGDGAVLAADLEHWDDRWVGAFADVDAVILLAGSPSPATSWEQMQRLNLDLTLNVYEAAARMRAKRLIFASSNWTMAGHRYAGGSLPTDRPPFPINAYGASKLVGERLGRSYSERWGMSCISLRIGYCQTDENRPGPQMGWGAWGQEMWLSNRDLCDGFEKAVTAPDHVRFAVLNLMSDNPGMRWDIETTRRVIGYAPRDSWLAQPTGDQLHAAATGERVQAMIEQAQQLLLETRF